MRTHIQPIPPKTIRPSNLWRALSFIALFGSPALLLGQTTYYLTTGTSNPQSGSITYYDLSTVAGGASNGLFTQPNQTALDYAAEGAAGTYNYYIVPGIVMGSPESSTSVVTTSTGYGWETASPLACDIAAGTWTFSNRFEGNIGAGSPSVYVEVSVYAFDGTSSNLLFNYSDVTSLTSNLSPGTPYSYSFTTNQGAFTGITGQSLKVEYYAQLVGGSAYAGGFIYLGYNTSSDYVTVPVCPPPTNTATNTSTGTDTATPTATNTDTPTNTSTDTATCTATSTSTNTDTSTQTATDTATDTPTDTAVNTATSTDTATSTSTNTDTNTDTATQTSTNTETVTSTDTTLNTSTSTNTATNTATSSSTNTATNTLTSTATSTSTQTSTSTNTSTSVNTSTNTVTATATATTPFTLTPTATSTQTVTFTPTPNIHLPVLIFPNPYTGNGPIQIQVPIATQGDIQVSIFTLSFRKVIERDFSNSLPGVDLSLNLQDKAGVELANGLYYVRIRTDLGTTLLKLLILR